MKMLTALLLLAIAASAQAQERGPLMLYLAGAVADDMTTWRDLGAGHREIDPIYAFAQTSPMKAVFALTVTDAVTLWLAHRYAPRHQKLVKIALLSLGGIRIGNGMRNAAIWATEPPPPQFGVFPTRLLAVRR